MFNLFNNTIEELVNVMGAIPENNTFLNFADQKSLPDMLQKMQNGCPILTSQYTSIPCPAINIVSATYQLANEGLFFDVATVLNGQPECWFNEDFSYDNKPAKDFYININFSYKITTEQIFQKLNKLVQIIDSLEGNGQRLNVFLVSYSQNKSKQNNASFVCKIKDQSEPLNLPQMIFLCGSSIMLRYCMLLLRQQKYGAKDLACTILEQDAIELQKENIYYIPSAFYDKNELGINDYTKADLLTAYKIK